MDGNCSENWIIGRSFAERPDRNLIERFREHVRNTNNPLSFPDISNTRPAKESDVVLLTEFELLQKAELAPCAICSAQRGKYRFGWLAWFSDDGLLRVIGAQCGRQYLKNFKAAERRFRAERKEGIDRQIIESAISRIPEIQRFLREAQYIIHDLTPIAHKMETALKEDIKLIRGKIRKNRFVYMEIIDQYKKDHDEDNAYVRPDIVNTGPVMGARIWMNAMSLSSRAKVSVVCERYGAHRSDLNETLEAIKLHPSCYEAVAKIINDAYRDMNEETHSLRDEWKFFGRPHFSRANRWLASFEEGAKYELIHPADNNGVFSIRKDRRVFEIGEIRTLRPAFPAPLPP